MTKKLIAVFLALLFLFLAVGCGEVKPITNSEESTIIKDAKSADEFIKKNDLNSLAYAYIYNLKSGLDSYTSETTGTISAKVLFIDYLIHFSSDLTKKGSAFYCKDHSASALMNVDTEYYVNGGEKIIRSTDLKNYTVFNMEDFLTIDYSIAQYTVSGFVFTDESILKAELISNENGVVSVKYKLDNEKATHIARKSMKNTGALSDYPTFSDLEMTLTMKSDLTPLSYEGHAVYDASKPILGSSTATEDFKCTLSKINETVEIPNEAFFIEKLGGKASELVVDKEADVKDELIGALTNVDFGKGVNIDGNFTVNIVSLGAMLDLQIGSSVVFDVSRLKEENIYNVFNYHAKLEGNDEMAAVIGIVKTFAGDALGEYASLLDDFKGIEIFCPGDGVFYLTPYNQDGKYYTVFKLKLSDVLDIILKNVNVYKLLQDSNNDLVQFVKRESDKADTYSVDVILNEDTVNSLKETIENFIQNDETGMVKAILMYEGFDSLKARIDVVDGKIDVLDVSFNYFKATEENGKEPETLFSLKLNVGALDYDWSDLVRAKDMSATYDSTAEIKSKLEFYANHFYLSKTYSEESAAVIEAYNCLTDEQKAFVGGSSYVFNIETNIKKIDEISAFLPVYYKIDLENPTNEDIYEILKKFEEVKRYGADLAQAIGDEAFNKLSSITNYIDYTNIDGALIKLTSTDESTWGLTAEELSDFVLIIKIGEVDSSVQFNMLLKLMMINPALDYDSFVAKITALNAI